MKQRIKEINTKLLLKEMNSGKIFTACFIKKNNELREINCRTNVKKYVTGKGLNFNPSSKNLLPVFDMQKKEYRFINLSSLIWVKIKKKKYFINDILINESINKINELNKIILK